MRKQQEHMAKQKNYSEAHSIQQHANGIEEGERQKYAEEVQKKVNASEANMMMKQQSPSPSNSSAKKRMATTFWAPNMQSPEDFKVELQQRYKNIMDKKYAPTFTRMQ